MIRILAGMLFWAVLAAAGAAQETGEAFAIGGDAFLAGTGVELETPGVDDAFLAGERVGLVVPITGTAHLAGRRVAVAAEVGGGLYAAGADVLVDAPVVGDATVAGYDLGLAGRVAGDLRAAGATVRVLAPVDGSALIAGREVEIDAEIAGDVVLAAEALAFGPNARIGGRLTIYAADTDPRPIPPSVIAEDRIERRQLERMDHARPVAAVEEPDWPERTLSFAVGVLILGALAMLVALVAPEGLERLRGLVRGRPFRAVWIGFLTHSALIGAAIVLGMTVIGLLAAPVVLVAGLVLGFLGFLVAVYLVGAFVWGRAGQLHPDRFWEHALVALIGALVVSLVFVVPLPLIGWLVILVLTWIGLGALGIVWLRPEFRS